MAWLDIVNRIQTAGQTVFGESVTFAPASGTEETVTGIFDAEHAYQEVIGDSVIETTRPVMTVRAAAFTQAPVRNDSVTVRETAYTITEIQPDGQGDLVFILEKSS